MFSGLKIPVVSIHKTPLSVGAALLGGNTCLCDSRSMALSGRGASTLQEFEVGSVRTCGVDSCTNDVICLLCLSIASSSSSSSSSSSASSSGPFEDSK